jgi:hypothetical protein
MFSASFFSSLAFSAVFSLSNAAAIVPRAAGDIPGWKSLGCYTDSVGSRTLANGQYLGVDMTVEICTTACLNNGYQYAGVEYANECYCDSQIAASAESSSACTMACAGNSTEICGGSNAINIYNSTTPASTGTGGPAKGVNATEILPFTYQGCYTDNNASGRALMYQQPDNTSMTVESCISVCSGLGYTIAGMEYSKQCFCDNYIRYSPSVLADGKCNMPCSGNSGEMCGAGNIVSIYSNGTMTPYKAATTQTTGLPGSWKYKGCLSDAAGGTRSLPYLATYSNNSNTYCLSLCQQYGYNAGGTEYGEQCFCGDQSDVKNAKAKLMPESDCNMVCSNDTGKNGGYICGGPNRISYYVWTGTTPLTKWSYASGNAAGQYKFLISGPTIPLVTSPGRNGKVTYLEKFGTSPANNGTGAYEFDISLVSNYTAAWRTMHVKSDIFCSASLTLPDRGGRQINIGGWANDATYGVRLYTPDGKPGVPGTNDWEENFEEVHLQAGRWYPSAMTMANGSILVVGGEEGSNGAPVPSIEVLPSPSGEVLYADYLDRTDPYNLYPYLAVLPSGNIFIAYYNEARLLDPKSLGTVSVLPNIPGAVNDPAGGRSYPFEGTSMLMPQTYPYTDPLKVMICGGSTPGPEIALDNCVTIAPDQPNANWTIERMPSKRVISCMVALPDGTYLIMNGKHAYFQEGQGIATNAPNRCYAGLCRFRSRHRAEFECRSLQSHQASQHAHDSPGQHDHRPPLPL